MKTRNSSLFALILAIVLVTSLVFTACGGNGGNESKAPGTESKQESEAKQSIEGVFSAGFGRIDITPTESVPLSGYGNTLKRMSQGYLDRLEASCVALTDEVGESVLVYTIDLIFAQSTWSTELRTNVSKATGIPAEHIVINGSHTHSAPDMGQSGTATIMRYKAYLLSQLKQCALDALADRAPATCDAGTTEFTGLNWVRNYLLSNGTYAGDNNGDFNSGTIVSHETEADPELRLVRFNRESAKDIYVVNWQCHPHRTGGMLLYDISADTVGHMRRTVEKDLDVWCCYVQGGAGNLNPTSRVNGETFSGTYTEYGEKLAGYVKTLAASDKMGALKLGKIYTEQKNPVYKCNHEFDHLLPQATEINNYFVATSDRATCVTMGKPYGIHSCYHASNIIAHAKLPESEAVELDAFAIGELGMCFAPFELYDQTCMTIRHDSKFKMTITAGYTNNYQNYLPTDYAFDHTCYEADTCRFIKGTAEEICKELTGMLNTLQAKY